MNLLQSCVITRPVIEKALDRRRRIYFAATAILVAALWLIYLGAAFLGKSKPGLPAGVAYLIIAVLATIAAGPFIGWVHFRLRALRTRGQVAHGTVVDIGSVAKSGMRPVTIAFSVQGAEYRTHKDVLETTIDTWDDQTRLPVLYDPHHPSHCLFLSDMELDLDSQPKESVADMAAGINEGLKEGAVQGLGQIVWLAICLGQMIGGLWLLNAAAHDYANALIGPVVLAMVLLTVGEQMLWERFRGYSGRVYGISWRTRSRILVVGTIAVIAWGTWAVTSRQQQSQQQVDRDRESREMREQARRAYESSRRVPPPPNR